MVATKTRVHYTAAYLLNPQHRVTVDLVGLGGTGSQVLSLLGRLNASLIALGHPGLYVRGWDPDTVSDANIGRQLFSAAEVGQFKAVCLMSRINRTNGTDWEARPTKYDFSNSSEGDTFRRRSNILITCVDSIAARLAIGTLIHGSAIKGLLRAQPSAYPYYWLDFGNAMRTGQFVLGTVGAVEQPKKAGKGQIAVSELPNVLQMFPGLKDQPEDESGPSCSLAEALSRQDLFINSTLANHGMQLLWNLFKDLRIVYHGAYLNLETVSVNPIKV